MRFLNYWAGVDNALLRRCPRHERSKYANSGALVLLTGTFAFSGASYAVYTVFERIDYALFFGAVWALMILNLDRLLLTTFPKCEAWYRQIAHALPRLILAGFVGFTVAHPITVRLFQPEILERIDQDATTQRKVAETQRRDIRDKNAQQTLLLKQGLPEYGAVDDRKKHRDRIVEELNRRESAAAQTELDIKAEIDGTAPSGKPTCGPICREKKVRLGEQNEDIRNLRRERDTATKAVTDAEQNLVLATRTIDGNYRKGEETIEHEFSFQINSIAAMQSKSFFARSSALDALAAANLNVFWMRRFLAVMLIVVEVIVVLIKIMTSADSADRLAKEITAKFETRIPKIALEMVGIGQPVFKEPPEPEPIYQADATAAMPLGHGIRRRNILVILTTIFVMVVMGQLGRPFQDIVTTGALFVATAPLLAYYQRKQAKEKAE